MCGLLFMVVMLFVIVLVILMCCFSCYCLDCLVCIGYLNVSLICRVFLILGGCMLNFEEV